MSDSLAELEWFDVHICVVGSPDEFWCQLPTAPEMLVDVITSISSARFSNKKADGRLGHVYLVRDPPHKNYRGKVIEENVGEDSVMILKVDYGVMETVAKCCLYPLSKVQLSIPAQAFPCCLDGSESVKLKRHWFESLIALGEIVDKEFQLKVVGRKADGVLLVDIREKDSDYDICIQGSDNSSEITSKMKVSELSVNMLEISHPMFQSTVLGEPFQPQAGLEKSCEEKDYR